MNNRQILNESWEVGEPSALSNKHELVWLSSQTGAQSLPCDLQYGSSVVRWLAHGPQVLSLGNIWF